MINLTYEIEKETQALTKSRIGAVLYPGIDVDIRSKTVWSIFDLMWDPLGLQLRRQIVNLSNGGL